MKTSIASHLLIVCFAGASLATTVGAQNRPRTVVDPAPVVRPGEPRVRVELKRGDRNFIEKAARASMEEVEVSRVAAERTSNPEVRRFAEMIIADHESVFDDLTNLAADKGVNLPAKESAEKWTRRDAKNFDRNYVDKMVSDHNDAVRMFEKHAKDGEDPDTVAYARKHLPKLLSHQQHAVDLQRILKDR